MSAPLFNDEAERLLLGGLLDGGAVGGAADVLQAADFHLERHGHIYGAALALYGAGETIVPATVARQLRRDGHTDIGEPQLEETVKSCWDTAKPRIAGTLDFLPCLG